MRKVVFVEHHGIGAGPAEPNEPILGRLNEAPPDAAAATIGCDGETVDMATPTIPPSNHGADEFGITFRIFIESKDQRIGITPNQRLDCGSRITRPMRIFRRGTPEIEN